MGGDKIVGDFTVMARQDGVTGGVSRGEVRDDI